MTMNKSYRYLIVGGGMTADSAVRGIRERDADGSIGVLCGEKHPPYNRPPLSKKLWNGKPLDIIWRKSVGDGVDLHLDTRATAGDLAAKTIVDHGGVVYSYDKLLLATGGVPRHLVHAENGVIYFRTVDDYLRLRALADRKAELIVIGGGFIGSEIAAALAMNGCRVTMVFPDQGIGARIYPPGLCEFLNAFFRDKGVTIMAEETIHTVQRQDSRFIVVTGGGKNLTADAVVAGIGIEPEVELARSLGLNIDNGIVVDEMLRAASPDVFAAGDVANFYSSILDVRRRVEHEDNANTMGTLAGRNMAGAAEKYDYLPYFYSDLFELGYEAVGEFGAAMDIIEDWREPFRKGVIYYLRAGRVRGVLLWNTWNQIDAARTLIGTPGTVSKEYLIGRIHD